MEEQLILEWKPPWKLDIEFRQNKNAGFSLWSGTFLGWTLKQPLKLDGYKEKANKKANWLVKS